MKSIYHLFSFKQLFKFGILLSYEQKQMQLAYLGTIFEPEELFLYVFFVSMQQQVQMLTAITYKNKVAFGHCE